MGEYGDFMGTLQQISALVVGECGDFDFRMPYSREECGDFASVQPRGDKERSIVRSIDGKMVEDKKKVSFKIHCFFYQTDHQKDRQTFLRLCRHKRL